jgi:hypothetical protein
MLILELDPVGAGAGCVLAPLGAGWVLGSPWAGAAADSNAPASSAADKTGDKAPARPPR